MKRFMKMKLAATVLLSAASMACAQPASSDPQSVTAEYLLNALVQIATQEDLSDEKRIGELLKIDIVMITEGPVEIRDGQSFSGATADTVKNPGYLTSTSNLYYRRWVAPERTGLLSLAFDSRNICMNVKDVYAMFIKHSALNQLPPPSQVPPPPGTFYPSVKKDQPVYGYAFRTKKMSGSLTFKYTNCLTDIQFEQPARNS